MKNLLNFRFLASIAVLFYCFVYGLSAQGPNLVPNPSFEDHLIPPRAFNSSSVYPASENNQLNPRAMHYFMRSDSILTRYRKGDRVGNSDSNITVRRWFRANMATPDYYHINADTSLEQSHDKGVRIPYIWAADTVYPVTGNAFAGIGVKRVPGYDSTYENREYITCRLYQPLENGKTYSVKFKYSMARYYNEETRKTVEYRNKHYLKKLGVGFSNSTQPILARSGDTNTYWTTDGSGGNYNTFEFDNVGYHIVENNNLGYYEAPLWGEFIEYLSPNQSGLQYMIIGNFDQKINLSDIIPISGRGTTPNSLGTYLFYFLIDDVEVREVANPDSCECKYIFTCPHTSNDSLENENPDKCCFTTPVRPDPGSCQFRFLRIKQGSTIVSDPPFIDFGGIVPKGTTVEASFCVDFQADETASLVAMEFLDEDSNVVCIKNEYVYCHCPCVMAGNPIAPGVAKDVLEPQLTQIANAPNGDCCWEFTLKNNYSCDYLDTSFSMNASAYNSTFTAMAPWSKVTLGSSINFVKNGSMAANSTSLVFKVCTPPQTGNMPIPTLKVTIGNKPSGDEGGSICTLFPLVPLECAADTNCCDLLEVILRKKSQTMSHDCEFDFIVRQKNGPKKCKFHRIRIKKGALTMHITDSTGTAMDLSQETFIWEDDLGSSCPQSLTPGYQRSATYTIEFLDSTGTVLCPVTKTFQCCYSSGVSSGSKMGMQEQSTNTKELTSGGIITNAVLNGKRLQYTVQNKGEAIPAKVQIIGLNGEVFQTVHNELKNGTNAGEMDISRLPNGTYYISIQTGLWQTSKQIIITK